MTWIWKPKTKIETPCQFGDFILIPNVWEIVALGFLNEDKLFQEVTIQSSKDIKKCILNFKDKLSYGLMGSDPIYNIEGLIETLKEYPTFLTAKPFSILRKGK